MKTKNSDHWSFARRHILQKQITGNFCLETAFYFKKNLNVPSQNLGHVQPHSFAWLSASTLCPVPWLHQGAVTSRNKIHTEPCSELHCLG
jgi:hypothetical protein